MAIVFHSEGVDFDIKGCKKLCAIWLTDVIHKEGCLPGTVSVIFCSDPYLLEINRQYLAHDYFTDIITFDYTEGGKISGDLFISIDTVSDNAKKYSPLFHVELLRVMVHGVLHLLGYKDKSPDEERVMRLKEDQYLKEVPEVLMEKLSKTDAI